MIQDYSCELLWFTIDLSKCPFFTSTGGDYAHTIRDWTIFDGPANLSHCFVAINPAFFAPGFEDRMSDLMGYCRNMEPVSTDLNLYTLRSQYQGSMILMLKKI